jgi:hypothetical protein
MLRLGDAGEKLAQNRLEGLVLLAYLCTYVHKRLVSLTQ